MDVQLQRPIRFSDAKSQEKPQIEEIQLQGRRRRSKAAPSMPGNNSFRTTRCKSPIWRSTNSAAALTGGPGWINTVRYGSDDMLPRPAQRAPNNAPAKADQLYCLHVTFQRRHHRQHPVPPSDVPR